MHVKLSLNLYFHCKNKKFLLYLAVIKRTIYHTKKHTMTLKPFYAKLKSLAKLPIGLVSVFLIFNTHTAISQIQDKQLFKTPRKTTKSISSSKKCLYSQVI